MAYVGYSQPNVAYPTYSNFYTPTQVAENSSSNSSNNINWVQGEAAARSYPVLTRNTSVLLMDSERDVFYIKSTDANGMPLPLRTFDYKEKTAVSTQEKQETKVETPNYVTKEEFDKRMNEIMNKLKKTEIKKEGKK